MAQNQHLEEKDSLLVKKLNDSSLHYAYSNSLKSIDFGKKALKVALELRELKSEAYAHISLARAYYIKGDYESSLNHGTALLKISNNINYGHGVAYSINNAGLIFLGQDNYKAALEEFYKALEINKKLNNLFGQSSNLFNIALCQINFKQYDLALESLERCSKLAQKSNPRVYIMAFNRLGDIAFETKQAKSALINYKKAIVENTLGDDWEKAYAYLGIANVFYQKGNFHQCIANAEIALDLVKKVDAHWDRIKVYEVLHKAHEKLEEFQKAYGYLQQYKLYSDSLYNEKKEKEINVLQLKQKAIENKELLQQVEIRKQAHKFNQLVILAVSLLTIFLVVMVVLILKKNTKISNLNKKLTENNSDIESQKNQILAQNLELERMNYSKDQLFSVIGHDLRSPIVSIIQTVDLLRSNSLSEEESNYIHKSFFERLTATATMLDNLLLWVNHQKMATTVERKNFLLPTVTEQLLLVLSFQANEKGVVLRHEPLTEAWVNADVNHTRIIIQNLISNAIKFTPSGGYIHIYYVVKPDKIGLVVKDNGVGIASEKLEKLFVVMGKDISTYGTADEKGIGIGLMLVKKYADENNAQIMVNSGKKGAEFTIYFDSAI